MGEAEKPREKFISLLSERIPSDMRPPSYEVTRGHFEGDFAFARYVDKSHSVTSDNASAIAHTLRTLADAIMASQGLELGEAQIHLVIRRHVRPVLATAVTVRPPYPQAVGRVKRKRAKR